MRQHGWVYVRLFVCVYVRVINPLFAPAAGLSHTHPRKKKKSHTHTPTENNTPDTHTHDKNNTPNLQTNTSHKHLTTLEECDNMCVCLFVCVYDRAIRSFSHALLDLVTHTLGKNATIWMGVCSCMFVSLFVYVRVINPLLARVTGLGHPHPI